MLSSARAVAIVLLGCSGACGGDDTSSASNGATTQPHDAGSDTDADTDTGDTFAAAMGGVTTGMFGQTAGVKLWVFPDGPDGLHPDQSWSSIAPAPDGSIYATGCDSRTNGALYRLLETNDRFGYVGDARTASIAGGNWGPNQNAEQFQVRPLWYREHVYLASSGYVRDGDSLKYRGFHWYTYDLRTHQLLDLSANEAAGVGDEHVSIVATALDAVHGYLYALGSPTAHLYQYEIAAGRTVDLGRHPELVQPYYTPGQVLWVDASGRVYFTVTNGGTLAPDEIGAPRYVLSWDGEQGWASRPDWQVLDVLRTGQWSLDRQRLYLLDYALNLYVFNGASFMRLGRGTLDDAHASEQTNSVRVRSIHLSPSERKIYFINDTAKVTSLYEWSFHDGSAPRELSTMNALDEHLGTDYSAFTGHDSWDTHGRFHVAAFGGGVGPMTPGVYLVRIDPVRLKAALGVLPGVSVLSLITSGDHLELMRTGARTPALDAVIEIRAEHDDEPSQYETVSVAAGATHVALGVQGKRDLPALAKQKRLRLVPDGDTYLVGSPP